MNGFILLVFLTLWRREAALSRHDRLPEYGARLLSAAALPSLGPSLVTSLCVEIFSRDKCPPVGGKMNYVVASEIEISRSYAIKREQGYPTAAPSPKSTAWVAKQASSAVAKGLMLKKIKKHRK